MTTKKPARRKSPSGYWTMSVETETPPIFGEIFRPGRDYVVADAVLEAVEAVEGAKPTAEPHVFPS